MYFRPRNLVFMLLILLCIVGAYFLYTETQEPNGVIAIVNGTKIFYKDVKAYPELVQLANTQEMNASRLNSEIHKFEIRRLADKIHEVIFKQKMAELGVTVSEKEVDFRVEEIFQKTEMVSEKAKAVCESAQAIYEALEAWQKNPPSGDVIYNEKLAPLNISKDQWKAYQVCFDRPEKLKLLIVPKNIDDMKKNSRESSRRDVLYKKLEDVITRNVSVKTEEIEAEYQKRYGHLLERPILEKVKDKLLLQLLTKKKQEAARLWWQEQYKQAKIEIKDRRVKDVLNILVDPLALP